MSGEFRELYSRGFAWQMLAEAAEAEQGSHQISQGLLPIYDALSEIEQGCAWLEAGDSGPASPVMALIEHGPRLEASVKRLMDIRRDYLDVVRETLRNPPKVENNGL